LFLLRIEPFTSVHIEIQGGRFDHPARIFSSIAEAYRSSSTIQNDYRELIPEFFLSPEFLVNANHFDLGTKSTGKVNDVALPRWARSPIEFVYLHRKALESDYVSQHLPEWIDLIWGYKQKGEQAALANNVFKREFYEDIWDITDPGDVPGQIRAEALLRDVGQIPPQLFDKPHPAKQALASSDTTQLGKASVPVNISRVLSTYLFCNERELHVHVIDQLLKTYNLSYQIVDIMKGFVMGFPVGRRGSVQRIRRLLYTEEAKVPIVREEPGHDENRISCFNGKSFDFVGDRSNELMTGNSELKIQHRNAIVAVASERDWTVIADRDSSLAVYRSKEFQFSIPIFTGLGHSLSIVGKFQLIVCGTDDGALLFCSLNKGVVTRIVPLQRERGISVLVTNGWGFVLVYSQSFGEKEGAKHYLRLFTVNGDPVRHVEINSRVVAWSTFTSVDGFDFVAMGLEDGGCYVFEAFYLTIGKSCFRSRSPAIGITFSSSLNVGIVATRDGNLTFFPHKVF
jgi:hypothetical protein